MTIQNSFKEEYEQAVTDALSILGQHISVLVTSYIEEKYSIRLSDTADNPKALSDALEATIDGATRIVQRRILRLLYNKIEIPLSFVITINFEDKILNARKEYEKKYD